MGKAEIRAKLKRFDAVIVLNGGRLRAPVAEVITDSDRPQQEYAAASGFTAFASRPAGPVREQAARRARTWAMAGAAGPALILLNAKIGA